MTRQAVATRKRRAAKKAANVGTNKVKQNKAARLFTVVQLRRLGFIVGAETLYNGHVIIPSTVTHITDTGITFHNGAVQYPNLLAKSRAKAVFFKDQHGNMTEMDDSVCYDILEAYCFNKQGKYTHGQHSYIIDWTGTNIGVQTNTSTGVKRTVELRPVQKSTIQGLLGVEFPVVDENNLPVEFQNHLKQLTCRTKKVYHLEPKLKGDRLLCCMQQIQRERGLPATTSILSHGCPVDALDAIVHTGFQNVGTSNGKVYGHGLYLTTDVNFAAGYSTANHNGQCVLLMCKTLVGGKETSISSTTALSSSAVRSGGSSGHILMKPWVNIGTDVNIAYAVEFIK